MNKPEYQSQNETKLSNMPPRPHQAKGKKKVNPAVVGGAVAGAAVLGVGGTAAAMSLSDDDNEEELPEEDILDLDSQEEEIVIGDGSGAGNGESIISHIFGGGLMLGAWFMATDYVTSPITPKGQYVYGIILGVLTGLFRLFGGSAEGVSYAIIISNLLVPLIEKVTLPKPFGKGGEK